MEVKKRPIIFTGESVRAILEGRKTQTRRVLRPQPVKVEEGSYYPLEWRDFRWLDGGLRPDIESRCPYGKPGDRLWVKETFLCVGPLDSEKGRIVYRATNNGPDEWVSPSWRPSMFMPRWASRITLEITGMRVERAQEISQEDIAAEGLRAYRDEAPTRLKEISTDDFRLLWDSINAKRGFGWEKNPWLWVIEFRKL